MDNFDKKIIEIRKILKLGQKEFAEKLGIPQGTLSNYELKKRTPNIDFFLTLLNIGVSPLYLFYDIGEPFDQKFNSFLNSYMDNAKNEKIELLPHIEDFIIHYLKETKKIKNSKVLELFFTMTPQKITGQFITNSLEELTIEDLKKLTISNAKDIMKNILRRRKLTKIDTETKRNIIIKEIDTNFSNLEIYVLLKHYDKFKP